MAYHVNFDGEVGECTATIACPFGSFDTDHYTTPEQARMAYELSQCGKEVAVALRKESFFKVRHSEAEREQKEAEDEKRAADKRRERERKEALKERERYERRIASMRAPKTKVPALELGHYAVQYLPRPGQMLDGFRVRQVDTFPRGSEENPNPPVTTVRYMVEDPEAVDGIRYVDALEESCVRETVWVPDAPHPEALHAYEAALKERKLEDFVHNYSSVRSQRWRLEPPGPAEQGYVKFLRIMKAKAEDYSKAGMAMPYTRAYRDASSQAGEVVQAAVDLAALGSGTGRWREVARRIVKDVYPKGEAPNVDVDVAKEWADREARNLV